MNNQQCSLGFEEPIEQKQTLDEIMSIKDIPVEQLKRIKEYANGLRKRNPNMKPSRMTKLVANKFNIKLV